MFGRKNRIIDNMNCEISSILLSFLDLDSSKDWAEISSIDRIINKIDRYREKYMETGTMARSSLLNISSRLQNRKRMIIVEALDAQKEIDKIKLQLESLNASFDELKGESNVSTLVI